MDMSLILDLAVTLVSAAVIAAYMWSVRGHFSSDTMPRGASVIAVAVIVSTLLFLFLTWFVAQPPAAQLAGLTLQLASAALFWAAILASRKARLRFVFDDEHPRSIVADGPYAVMRHPFYVSYVIFWTGWAVAVWSPWAVVNVVVLTALYVMAAQKEERGFDASPLAAAYAEYRTRAGFFWPRF